MAERGFVLQARGIAVDFGAHAALRDIDLDIGEGERIVVLGANGAGKSVLLRTLHGLLAPTRGTLAWAGDAPRPVTQAMVFQRPVLLRRSALANVEFALAVNGVEAAARKPRALAALDRVGLAPVAGRAARALSGGEQQRLALARAWSLDPRLLFLDEPTASLDPAAAGEVERIVREIHASGTTVVLTTHNLGLARRVDGDIVLLDEGRVAERTPAGRFFTRPESAAARQFLEGELP